MITRILTIGLWFTLMACQKMDPAEPGSLVPMTVDQDHELPYIEVNGTMLHAETFGDSSNPMIIVLHGGPGVDYRSMLNCQLLAADGYFIVFYDQRGSGLSMRYRKDAYRVDVMLEDLKAVIDHYRQSASQKVFLLGHSWGAMLATAYINEYPLEISGALLAEPGGFTWQDTKDQVSRTRKGNPFDESFNDVFYVDQFITATEDNQNLLDYKLAIVAAYGYAPGNVQGIEGPYPFWRFGAVVNNALFEIAERDGFDFTTQLHQYITKVCFVYSENNQAYGMEYAKKVSSAYPQAELKEIKGTGHEMFYFSWDQIHGIALEYFNSLK